MHQVRIDRINLLVEQRISGAPDLAEIEAAGASVRKAIHALGTGPEAHVTLIDCAEMAPIGDDAIASAFAQWNDPRFSCVRARKVAVIVPSALARLKLATPAKTRPNMRLFATRAEALRWLFA